MNEACYCYRCFFCFPFPASLNTLDRPRSGLCTCFFPLPFCDVMQELHHTDPTWQTCAHEPFHANPTRQTSCRHFRSYIFGIYLRERFRSSDGWGSDLICPFSFCDFAHGSASTCDGHDAHYLSLAARVADGKPTLRFFLLSVAFGDWCFSCPCYPQRDNPPPHLSLIHI